MRQFLSRRALFPALAVVLISGIALARGTGSSSPAKKYGPIPWTSSLPKAQKVAAKEKKDVFVDFYAEWCGPCQQMLHTTYKNKAVVARAKQFVPVLINVDKQQKLAEKFGVEAIPTTVFIGPTGKVLRTDVGYHSAKEWLKITGEVLKSKT